MKRLVTAAVAGLTFSSAGLLLAQAPEQKKIEAGMALFSQKECNKCHQIAGKGSKDHPLDHVATKISEADIRKWLTSTKEMEATLEKQPKLKMSSKKPNLTATEVDQLVAYLRTLK